MQDRWIWLIIIALGVCFFTCFPILQAYFYRGSGQSPSQPFPPAEITIAAQNSEECVMADAKIASSPSTLDGSNSQHNDKDKCIAMAVYVNEATNEEKSENFRHTSYVFTTLGLEYQNSVYQLSPVNYSTDNAHFV